MNARPPTLAILLLMVGCGSPRVHLPSSGGGQDGGSGASLVITPASLPAAEAAVGYAFTLSAAGGNGALVWSLAAQAPELAWATVTPDGVLESTHPPGLTVAPPGASLVIAVTDASHQTASRSFLLSVGCNPDVPIPCGFPNPALGICQQGFSSCVNGQSGACTGDAGSPGTVDLNDCGASCGVCPSGTTDQCIDGRCVCGASDAGCPSGSSCCPTSLGSPSVCRDTQADLNHCGDCVTDCVADVGSRTYTTPGCDGGVCSFVCANGYQNCDHNDGNPNLPEPDPTANGCETHVASDVRNCGGCGLACSLNHDTPACDAGQCELACALGYQDCNQNVADGCETNLVQGDPNHCGTCQTACSTNHDTPACQGGGCVLSCDPGWGDCDGQLSNGCETNVLSSLNDCGSCGALCSGNHDTPSCLSGKCHLACAPGWANCDGRNDDGCEAQLGTNAHCADCSPCTGASACIGGKCCIPGKSC